MINSNARRVIKKYGLSKIIDAFGHSLPTVLQLHNYPNFLTKVDMPGAHQYHARKFLVLRGAHCDDKS